MKHHYIVSAIMNGDFLCPMGAVCEEEELKAILKRQGVKRFKVKMIDAEPVEAWEEGDWQEV